MIESPRLDVLPYLSGECIMARLRRLPWPAWLDGGGAGGWDIITAEPTDTLVCRAGQCRHNGQQVPGRPLDLLERLLGRRQVAPTAWPFAGGALGAFGYDLGEELVVIRNRRPPSALPAVSLGFYDWAVLMHHEQRRGWLLTLPGSSMNPARWRALMAEPAPPWGRWRAGPVEVDLDAQAYGRAFRRLQAYIRDGDCYQANLARCFSATFRGDAFAAYRQLRGLSPAPHGAYLEHPGFQVLSISPERFLKVRTGRVETRPIKGTRPRGRTADEDRLLARQLRHSDKDLAENVMIVDLLRNDMGRVCRTGSVRVRKLFELESHPSVHHLVSTVEGELPPGCGPVRLLEAAFPGGSITGAPKRRAMEIIAELEPSPRGLYCGSIGYLGYDGSMDASIAIRTAVCADGRISYRAGGGIVADSREADERLETEHKARPFFQLLGC
ncbi:MAG: aminodeoxychorismate synthase component I [Ectothiorhodospiraceae bacterium]|nr:aminodeoxychorismate synthase component I [Ectothiorhodospiraceae bacterium]